ncbi:hypothetical protein [Acinetobacter sp. YH01012]|uniref:hypothetical protein n=1 Tax=Acinetobacter sp. YH01012 TaxID=2601028 RepID=UPI0015D259A6|nr:hypothetical protein [Acinetobacter sp. YH01012]
MKTLYLFKLFCFSAAALSAYHLYTELMHNPINIFQVITLAGLIVVLSELGYRSRLTTSVPASSATQADAPTDYAYLCSKLAASSIATCFIVQSWMA